MWVNNCGNDGSRALINLDHVHRIERKGKYVIFVQEAGNSTIVFCDELTADKAMSKIHKAILEKDGE